MKRTKLKITVFALAFALIFSVAAFFAINFKPAKASGTVTVSGSNVFTAFGEANVVAHLEEKQSDDEKDKYYTLFTFGDNEDNISYRKNLAYNWWEEVTEGEGDDAVKKPEPGYFSMEIGLRNTAFKKFVIAFESQQYAKTEEGKTVNYIMFFPDGNDDVKVVISQDKDDDASKSLGTISRNHINIKFTGRNGGDYNVEVSNGGNPKVEGKFENVGGTYAKYSSSSTTPVYPLIFSAEFEEAEEGAETNKTTAQMVLYSMNNQAFEVTNASKVDGADYYTGTTVTDNAAPVLCLNKEISYLTVGGSVKFDYQVIDVLRSSPSSTLYYYVLKHSDLNKTENAVDFDAYNEKDDEGLFEKVETDTILDSDKEFYLPEVEAANNTSFKDIDVDMAVKVYAKISDTSSSYSENSYVFLDWYLKDNLKLGIKSNDENYDFIAVGEDKSGVTYNYDNDKKNGWSDKDTGVIATYQKKVEEAAKNLSAGSASYFYLPSAEELFADNVTAYTDMKLSIYYYYSEQSSNTSLNTNNLSINVTKPGNYVFTIYATDAAENEMYYLDENGERVEFGAGDIWDMYEDDEKHSKLPWFEFSVDYKGVQFKETPGKQSTAYVGTNYSSASFEINGVESSYTTKYRLFIFDRAEYYEKTGKTFTYDEFIENMDALFESNREYFDEIKEVTSSDEDYDKYKDYNWSSTSTSFTPQDGNAFYYMIAEVTDTEYNTAPVTCSLAVVASVEAKALKGDNEWLQNNIASVVLLSVAGVSLIAIILLLVIKPKSKEDIDVQYEQEINKKKKN